MKGKHENGAMENSEEKEGDLGGDGAGEERKRKTKGE